MQFNIEESIKYPFLDKEWIRKAGVIFAIQIGVSAITGAFRFIGNLSSYVPDVMPYYSSLDPESWDYLIASMTPYVVSFLVSLLTIPITIYVWGYLLETRKNVMNGVENPAPENDNIGYKFKLSLSAFLVALGPIFTIGMLGMIITIPLVLIAIALVDSDVGAVALVLAFIGIGFVWFLAFTAFLLTAIVIVPSMLYIYLKTGSIGDAYDYAAVFAVAKAGWKRMVVVMLLMYAFNVIASFLGFMLCFIGFIVQPILQTWLTFTEAHLMGTVYKQIDGEGVLEFESEV